MKVSAICGYFYIAQNPSGPSEIIYTVKGRESHPLPPPPKLTGKKVIEEDIFRNTMLLFMGCGKRFPP